MAEDTPTEDDLVRIMDEWVDDLAPLNRGAFKFAARAIVERYPLGLTVQPSREKIAQIVGQGTRHAADEILALLPGRTEREVLAQGWDEGAEFMDSDHFWHDNAKACNPYRSEADHG